MNEGCRECIIGLKQSITEVLLGALTQVLMFFTCVLMVPVSKLGQDTDYTA
jgi:hypothetical protein